MTDIIFHHYWTSPFSEKIRAILGYKKLTWQSVITPAIMPKPELVALTGGYRRAPVMQVGNDIYCDTALIARLLERIKPDPTLFPRDQKASCEMQAQWADKELFLSVLPVVFQAHGYPALMAQRSPETLQAFQKDRQALGMGKGARLSLAAALSHLHAYLQRLNDQLADGRDFLSGSAPTVADFAIYHPLWFVHKCPGISDILVPYTQVQGWREKIADLGNGEHNKLDALEAINIAKQARPVDWPAVVMQSDDCQVGDTVEVMPTDYGLDPVRGELVFSNPEEIAIRRRDERAGELVVHFPRIGFQLNKPTS